MTVYVLSVMKGLQTCIHLKEGKVLSILHMTSLHHDELMEQCKVHLAYLGFSIFLHLVHFPPLMPHANILGSLQSDNPKALQQLVATSNLPVTMGPLPGTTPTRTLGPLPGTTPTRTPSAVVGSAAQLSRVEKEVKQVATKPTHALAEPDQKLLTTAEAELAQPSSVAKPAKKPKISKVNVIPFQVVLKILTNTEIQHYTKIQSKASKAKGEVKPKVTPVSVLLHKLSLAANQRVIVAPPKSKAKII